MPRRLKTYYALTKPGIIYGNAINAAGGFFLASQGHINWALLAALLTGSSLVVASACVINNVLDRGIDRKMMRTKQRALAVGSISVNAALKYGVVLAISGFGLLAWQTNWLVVSIGIVGFASYLLLYGLGKRRTVHGTLIGSIAGATPPMAGYCAVTGQLDTAAWLLFLIVAIWQMPHFYAIAIYRLKDYTAAGLPVLPAAKGVAAAKVHIVVYVALYMLACCLLTVFGYTGLTYLVVMLLLGGIWLGKGIAGLRTHDNVRWARKMFGFSLIVTLAFSIMISIDHWLP